MDLIFGMPVVGRDGDEAGTLERVLVDPNRRQVTHIVVRSPHVSEEVLLPLSLVQGNAESRLLLHADSGDLEHLPRYYDGRLGSPPAERVDTGQVPEPGSRRQDLDIAMNVPPDAREYGPTTRVATNDAEGQLVSLSAEQYDDRISALRASGLLAEAAVVPARWLGELQPGCIVVNATSDQLDQIVGQQAGLYIAQQAGEPRRVEERSQPPG